MFTKLLYSRHPKGFRSKLLSFHILFHAWDESIYVEEGPHSTATITLHVIRGGEQPIHIRVLLVYFSTKEIML